MIKKSSKTVIRILFATLLSVVMASTPVLANHATVHQDTPQPEDLYAGQAMASEFIPIQPHQARGVSCVRGINPGSHLNVRSGPGTGYRIVGTLANRTVVIHQTLGTSTPGWLRISSPVSGYVSTDFIGPAVDSLDPSAGCPA